MTTTTTAPACPTCFGNPALTPGGIDSAWICGTCGGGFLPREQCYAVVVERMGVGVAEIGQLLARPGPQVLRCPGCASGTSAIVVRGTPVDMCSRCGGLWLMRGRTLGAAPAPRPAAIPTSPSAPARVRTVSQPNLNRVATRPAKASSSWRGTIVAVSVMGIVGAGAFWTLTRRDKVKQEAVVDPDAALNLGSDAYDVYELGGRNMVWWRKYLQELRGDVSEAGKRRYELAVRRARALRMNVTETADSVVVRPSRELARAILRRQGAEL
ncbi:MAG: zf-TFIIB domain-containing protein [Myxococcota bacterium]